MNKIVKLLIVASFGWVGILLVSCTPDDTADPPTLTLDGVLNPYLTNTPSPFPQVVSETPETFSTAIPSPTTTPFVYTVVENDTLTAIALQHSVTLEDLIAANPGIDPNFLTVGLTLTIPTDGVVVSEALPSATPVPIDVHSPNCYSLSDGSLRCLALVENGQTSAVENIVALISLLTEDGDDLISKTAITPLNWLPVGERSVVEAVFEAPIPDDFDPHVRLLTTIPLAEDDQRYLNTNVQLDHTEIAEGGGQAKVSGVLTLNSEQPSASTVWIAAIAFDAQSNIVGVRKWITNDEVLPGGQLHFGFVVYSLGPPIEYVEVLTESRP